MMRMTRRVHGGEANVTLPLCSTACVIVTDSVVLYFRLENESLSDVTTRLVLHLFFEIQNFFC